MKANFNGICEDELTTISVYLICPNHTYLEKKENWKPGCQ